MSGKLTIPTGPRVAAICECGDHAFALTTRGLVALVSAADAHLFDRCWYADPNYRDGGCAIKRGDKDGVVVLANEVMGIDRGSLVVADHESCDPLDNRRGNLRVATLTENARNRRASKRPLPKGVWKRRGKFRAAIMAAGERIDLGTFCDVAAAEAAYRSAAVALHGDFARVG